MPDEPPKGRPVPPIELRSDVLDLPTRTRKPRDSGLTVVVDAGLGVRATADLLETAHTYIDIVKLGWGTALITSGLKRKIQVYRLADIPVYVDGILLEIAMLQDRLDSFLKYIEDHGITVVEISARSVDIERARKLELIKRLTEKFRVVSVVGFLGSQTMLTIDEWTSRIQEELAAGAWKVIVSGGERGTSGPYKSNREVRIGVVEGITQVIPPPHIIFEAPHRKQQAWLVRRLGANVNLANVPHDGVVTVESFRLGLSTDTLPHFHKNKR
ncbi:MAG: phosphosulfolactate synthase [Planctomycetota bacterium]|nr:MAG: phosphosulfolactate synthase [Planctomycetota bacterium]